MVYLYRAINQCGNTIGFYFSKTRNTTSAKLFLNKALRKLKNRKKSKQLIQIKMLVM